MQQRSFYKLQRLFISEALGEGITLSLCDKEYHYLCNVLRLKVNDQLLVFNGKNGEWLSTITQVKKNNITLHIIEQTREQPTTIDLHYCFAPLKQARLDYMIQKAVEMGANILQPVLTQHRQQSKVSMQKMEANAIEACEQCGNLTVPSCFEPISLDKLLSDWDESSPLLFCDEVCLGESPLAQLQNIPKGPKIGVLIGPEGGFSSQERKSLRALPFVVPIGLGPRILRADTAAVAALTLVGLTLGDW